MIILSLGPCAVGAVLSGEPILLIVLVQTPLYLTAMTAAAFRLNTMLVTTMRAERENDHRARHDALTGLSNQAGISGAIETRLAAVRRGNEQLALLYLDLDGFKAVNDTHGHASGDQLLKMVSDRLSATLRAGDIAARIGGDEFVVLARISESAEALALGERLIAAITTSYDLDGASARIGVSAGIALAPEHGNDDASLLAAADAALYEAKSSGKARCHMASLTSTVERLHRMSAEAARPAASIAA
jgi:diguanylate cyclase (GGDEF)-like protein